MKSKMWFDVARIHWPDIKRERFEMQWEAAVDEVNQKNRDAKTNKLLSGVTLEFVAKEVMKALRRRLGPETA